MPGTLGNGINNKLIPGSTPGLSTMKKIYIKPTIKVEFVEQDDLCLTSKYNDVGNFGFGDKDDDDRAGDDNWDDNWGWGNWKSKKKQHQDIQKN